MALRPGLARSSLLKNGFISATMKVCGQASRTGFDMGDLNGLVSIPSLSRPRRHLLHQRGVVSQLDAPKPPACRLVDRRGREISHRCFDTAGRQWNTRHLKAHFDASDRGDQGQIIAITQVSDTEHAPLDLAQTGTQ